MASATRYLRPETIAQVRRLDLRARFIVEGFLSGLHRSPYHGFSVEFSEHRKYTPGDDLRQIDWAVFGKTDRFYIKKHQAETNLECYLLVDTSASMDYPTRAEAADAGRLNKLDYAICLAAALGYMTIHQQDAVGLARFDDRLRALLPARSRRDHLMRLIGELAAVTPQPDRAGKGLAEALHQIARRIPKRGLMVILSDFLTEPAPVIDALHHLRYRGHDLILFQILDHDEVVFPFTDPRIFEDPETKQTLTTSPDAIRTAYLDTLRSFIEDLRQESAALRADFAQVDTSLTFDRALTRFLVDRRRRF